MIDTNEYRGDIKTYVLGFMFDSDYKLVLMRKKRPDWQFGLLNGVGGKVEKSIKISDFDYVRETGHQAMAREFEEETGIITSAEDWECYAMLGGSEDGGWVMYVFRAFIADVSVAQTVTDEEIVIINDANDLPEDCVANVKWLVPMAMHTDFSAFQINESKLSW